MTKKELWDIDLTPTVGATESIQEALDWWHDLPIQCLQRGIGWANLCMKYYPERNECYHFTGEQIEEIYNKEVLSKQMKDKEKQLVGRLLDLASDEFSNHGCNDLEPSWFSDWSKEEKRALITDMVKLNIIDVEDEDDDEDNYDFLIMNDSILMSYFARKLMKG